MLLLHEQGLPAGGMVGARRHGGTVRGALGMPGDHVLFCGLAIGHADPAAPVNTARIGRARLCEVVRLEGF